MSNIQAHVTTMSQTSSTECGRRNHSTISAARLRSTSVDTVPIKVDVKCPPLIMTGKMSCLAVTIQAANDIATPTAATLPRIALAGPSPYFRAAIAALQQCIAEHQKRETDVPDLVKPDRRLRAGIEKPGRGEQTGKGQGVNDRCHRGEQISAGEQQQRPRAHDGELRKQQDGRDQVVDCERGLIARNEGRNRGKRHGGVERGADEQNRGNADDAESPYAVTVGGRQGRKKDLRSSAVCIVVSGKLASNAPSHQSYSEQHYRHIQDSGYRPELSHRGGARSSSDIRRTESIKVTYYLFNSGSERLWSE